ncbi:MAG: hypothetical protein QXJ74_04470 [Nitrososphaera sp.]|uniref:hypothetical protein n=1 Tax=Nitrososphaera sp. TaxID=1971748 RepID=UPI0017D5E582|nr:hypothetical protein [Nitrososphaera sp.]NWG36204.1 hypothetical protein [Nitrososphaera sp.]
MRIPLKGSDHFCSQVNAAFEKIQQGYLESVKPAIEMRKASAMLGDGTVTQADTFDPQNVQNFYQRLENQLEGWMKTGISRSNTDDLHRLFCQFNKDVGKYYISGYFGVQFHALPYYKADRRVVEIQKELAKIAEGATAIFSDMTGKVDKALHDELARRGFADMEFQELFTKMFEDEALAGDLDRKAKAVEGQFPEFQDMGEKKNRLFAELNDLMIELYQTAPAGIDYNRLMQGEEGVCTYFDIELIKNRKTSKREAVFETKKIPQDDADRVTAELEAVADALRKARKA